MVDGVSGRSGQTVQWVVEEACEYDLETAPIHPRNGVVGRAEDSA